jgi:hypothetical protein
MKGKCECCTQLGELERFPAPLPAGRSIEVMMCEPCRNGDPIERFMEFVMVPMGVLRKTGRRRNGKNIYKSLIYPKN